MQCYTADLPRPRDQPGVSVRYLRGYAVLRDRRDGHPRDRRVSVRYLRGYAVLLPLGDLASSARAQFQSAICADMQCYTMLSNSSHQDGFVSVRYLRGYAVLRHEIGCLLAQRQMFQSAICADMQCYTTSMRTITTCPSVSVRYLRGYAVLRVVLAGDQLAMIRFSPLSARICSATYNPFHEAGAANRFQSAICADMQCYRRTTPPPRPRRRVSVRYLRGYAVLQVNRYENGMLYLFQSAICADMQCYRVRRGLHRLAFRVSVRYLRGYAVLHQLKDEIINLVR